MLFSYNWLQLFFKKKLPHPEKLVDLLSRHFAEVEGIQSLKISHSPFKGLRGARKERNDFIFNIDIRPNRAPDCFSHLGVAREISAILGYKLEFPNWKLVEDENLRTEDFIKVEVKDGEACPRYTARVISDVKVKPSPPWMREILEACGLRSINNIVDIANYVMLEMGQPLHAFDFEKIESEGKKRPFPLRRKIIVRKAKKGEKIVTLDDEKYELNKEVLIIADEREPLAIAGIKGGKKAEIKNTTKIVVLEAANFNQRVIRRGSKIIDLKTDASRRFEHGLDPNLTEIALNRASYLIKEIAGGKITKGVVDFYPKKVLPKRIELDLDYLESLLGVKIPPKEIKEILERLTFKISKIQSSKLEVEVPTSRLDISIPEDLIEEIGRMYGYEKIPAVFPFAALIPPKRNLEIFWEDMVKDILKELGFSEVYNYSFVSEEDINLFQYKSGILEIENPISADYQYLRPSLIPNLLKNVFQNQNNFSEIRIFEIGKIFGKKGEKKMLAGLITSLNPNHQENGENFYQLKGMIDLLFNKLGIPNLWYDEYQPSPEESSISIWHPKRCAEIKLDHQEIGFLGEISPRILETLKIKGKVTVFDLDFEKIVKLASEEHEYQPISRYPAAIRDIAILVPKKVRVEEVLNQIYDAGGELIRDVDLFDIYEGEEIEEGKKNLAFHIIYQAKDRTLTAKEIEDIQEKIINTLEKNPEWEVRR